MKKVILFIIIEDAHKFIDHCLIPSQFINDNQTLYLLDMRLCIKMAGSTLIQIHTG